MSKACLMWTSPRDRFLQAEIDSVDGLLNGLLSSDGPALSRGRRNLAALRSAWLEKIDVEMKGLWLLLPLADAAMRRALVVVDMTVEQVANISYRKKEVISTIRNLAQNGQFDALIDSHLWFEKGGPPSSLAEMYPDIGRAGTPGAELIPELRGLGLEFVKKYQYSCFGGGADLERHLREHKIDEVVITGINTDYCVLATALDSFYALFQTRVVESGVSSFNGRAGHLEGVRSIHRFLGDIVVGAEEFLPGTEAVTIQE
eukprot:s3918_g8.t2